ncbi:MAG: POTRA domain-containing protein, partial [Solirubrobacteraceae bacterium]
MDSLPLIETRDFAKLCTPFFGKPITEDALNRLVAAIDGYVKARGQLLAKVDVPPQTIANGVFRMALIIGRYPLRRLVVADTAAHARTAKVPPGAGRVVAAGVPQLATPEFARYIAPYFGKPITLDSVEKLRTAVADYLKHHDLAIVSVPEPTVDVATGEIRAAAIIGRYNELVFRGNRWFSDRLLQRQLGIKPGEEVRLSTLRNALNWANQNPFRHLQVLVNTVNLPPGVADLDVSVAERVPVRVALSYDDAGNDVIGNNQYSASVLFGNLWGRDHQLSYQFTTTDALHLYQVQSLDYRAPLPWRNYLEFSAALADVRPTFYGGFGHEHNRNVIADLRYIAPVTLGSWSLDVSGGLDYK